MTRDKEDKKSGFTKEALTFCDELKEEFERLISQFETSAKKGGKKIKIQVEWLLDADFNAGAELIEAFPMHNENSIQGGIYRISITEGLLIKLIYSYEILLTLMSRTCKRPAVGAIPLYQNTSGNGYSSEYVYMPNYFDIDLNLSIVDLEINKFSPEALAKSIEQTFWPFQLNERHIIDPPTRQHVLYAVTFLAFHESSHIVRGHLDYLQEYKNIHAFTECHSYSDADSDVQMRQSMEIDADKQAISNIIQSYFNKSLHDIPTFAEVCSSSLIILFSLFDMRIRSVGSYKTNTHPEPDVRVLSAINYASNMYDHFFQIKYGISDKEFSSAMLSSLHDSSLAAVRAFQELGIVGGGPQRLVDYQSNGMLKVMENLSNSVIKAQDSWQHRMKISSESEGFLYE